MKIAPTLEDILDDRDFDPWRNNTSVTDKARKELRALLAVARAAESWRCEHKDEDCIGCKRVDRALARLDRVSGERKG